MTDTQKEPLPCPVDTAGQYVTAADNVAYVAVVAGRRAYGWIDCGANGMVHAQWCPRDGAHLLSKYQEPRSPEGHDIVAKVVNEQAALQARIDELTMLLTEAQVHLRAMGHVGVVIDDCGEFQLSPEHIKNAQATYHAIEAALNSKEESGE